MGRNISRDTLSLQRSSSSIPTVVGKYGYRWFQTSSPFAGGVVLGKVGPGAGAGRDWIIDTQGLNLAKHLLYGSGRLDPLILFIP